jgi:hypothetical protein
MQCLVVCIVDKEHTCHQFVNAIHLRNLEYPIGDVVITRLGYPLLLKISSMLHPIGPSYSILPPPPSNVQYHETRTCDQLNAELQLLLLPLT